METAPRLEPEPEPEGRAGVAAAADREYALLEITAESRDPRATSSGDSSMRDHRTTSSILAALVLIAAAPLRAEPAGTSIAVIGLTAPPDQVALLAELADAIRSAAADSGLSAPASAALRASDALALSPEDVARVDEARRLAREHYLRFDFDGARAALDGARRGLLERYADLFCHAQLIDVDLELADLLLNLQDHVGQGAQVEAFSLLLEAARCRPDLEPSPDELGPRVIAAWANVRSRDTFATPDGAALAPRNIQRLASAGATAHVDAVVTGALSSGYDDSATARIAVLRVGAASAVAEEEVTLGPRPEWERSLRPVLIRLLAATAPRPSPPTGSVLVLSTPPGASIAVDGVPAAGVTPMLLTVSPGPHRLTLSLGGYDRALIDVTAWERQTSPVEVRLSRLRTNLGRRLWWLWTTLAVSAAGAVAGMVVWAVNESTDQPDLQVDVVRARR